jgi:hypothetical protein
VVAEKGISVSNVVNGTTRLQPCVLLIGQAAGVLAALAVQNKKSDARQISVREVQSILLQQKAYLMPYADVNLSTPGFYSIQRIGACGFLRGKGQPNAWANRTWFEPDSTITVYQFLSQLPAFMPVNNQLSKWLESAKSEGLLSVGRAVEFIEGIKKSTRKNTSVNSSNEQVSSSWTTWGLSNYNPERAITKRELAILLDKIVDPFSTFPVNHLGNYTSP